MVDSLLVRPTLVVLGAGDTEPAEIRASAKKAAYLISTEYANPYTVFTLGFGTKIDSEHHHSVEEDLADLIQSEFYDDRMIPIVLPVGYFPDICTGVRELSCLANVDVQEIGKFLLKVGVVTEALRLNEAVEHFRCYFPESEIVPIGSGSDQESPHRSVRFGAKIQPAIKGFLQSKKLF